MNQICAFIENKPGALGEFTKALSNGGVNIMALSLTEADGFGIVRLITEDNHKATMVLKDNNIVHNVVPVVAVSIEDKTGGLSNILDILQAAGINIEYMYAFSTGSGNADFVFKVSDSKKATIALKSEKINVIE